MARRPQLTGRAAVLAIVVCAIAMSLAYPIREYVAQRRYIAQLEQQRAKELAEIKEQEDRYRQHFDPGYIKRQGRERLFYCDPGRKCYVVMRERQGQSQGQGGSIPAGGKKAVTSPWYQTLWESVEAADSGTGAKVAGTGG
ncbi:septum formation initiator family protein [Streptosporangium sp. NPDC001559]|uniref:septum formation initiator family protein n=1 Tax=Streptosporangium sp. NPDC001559 TaxID=3366187 RepID=UPI0036E03FFE